MKVLFLASYISILDDDSFNKNITGYGYMVRDIADYVSRSGVSVDVITSSAITNRKKYNEVTLLKRTWADIFFHVNTFYLKKMIQFITFYHVPNSQIIKLIFYYFSAGYVEYVLKHERYDIVHIHGIGFSTKPFIDCCERLGKKYIVTLHGLNAFSDSVQIDSSEKQLEKDFLQESFSKGLPITLISTGILNVIKKYLLVQGDINYFYVINNGTNVSRKTSATLNIRQKHGIGNDKKIMLCVGNISKRKNQVQIVRAYEHIPQELKSRICILFLGNNEIAEQINQKIDERNLNENLIVCGNIDREEIGSYYMQADYTILVSISEGFGLSIIEGFVYGLPCLTYKDLDAIGDLYNEKTMIVVSERSDAALSEGFVQILSRNWDRDYIKQYAKKFSLQQMALKYVRVYEENCCEK